MAAQYTRIDALRQTAGGPLRPFGGAGAVAAGARQLHHPQALRRPVGAHPCALVRGVLPLRAPGRGRPGGTTGPGYQLRTQERAQDLGHGLAWPAQHAGVWRSPCWPPWMSRGTVPAPLCPAVPERHTNPTVGMWVATGQKTTVDVGLALLTGYIAERKGRDPIKWAIFGFFVPVVALLIVAIVDDYVPPRNGTAPPTGRPTIPPTGTSRRTAWTHRSCRRESATSSTPQILQRPRRIPEDGRAS